MFYIRGLFILFLWTFARAQEPFYGAFSTNSLEVKAIPGSQNVPEAPPQETPDYETQEDTPYSVDAVGYSIATSYSSLCPK